MSKYLDGTGLQYLWNKIKALLGAKVDRVEGKGLSSQDYTAEEKTKLAGLENYTLPAATADALGGVMVGSGLTVSDGVLSADAVDWANVQNKPELALKNDLASVYKYKGSVASYTALPTEGRAAGDVWNTEDTGMNYAWTGEAWDALGESFEIQSITNAEIDAILEG